MASMFGAFAAAGALQGVGEGMVHERNLQEALDTQYKLQQSGLDAAKQLDAAKKQTDEQDKLAQIRAKRGTLVGTDQEVASMYENQKKGMVTLGDGTDAMPGVPAVLLQAIRKMLHLLHRALLHHVLQVYSPHS